MTDNKKITFSEAELAEALRAAGFVAYEAHAKNIFTREQAKAEKLPETITADELRGAVRKLVKARDYDGGLYIDNSYKYKNTDEFADALLREAKTPSEPEYPIGAVVRDAGGVFWRRRTSAGGWELFGSRETYSDRLPRRPLERVDK